MICIKSEEESRRSTGLRIKELVDYTRKELISEFVNDLKSIRFDEGSYPDFGVEILIKKWEEKLK